jgi:DHA1 family multidrug resistance protein-like MFS transporter
MAGPAREPSTLSTVTARARSWTDQWGPILPLLVAEFIVLLGFGALLPVLPLYAAQHGIDPQSYGIITAAWPLAKLFAEPIFGAVADRTGRHRVLMVTGMVLMGIFMIVPLFFTSAAALFVSRFLAGGATGMYDPAARGLIVDRTPEEKRGEAFGLYTAFQMGGFVVGPVIGAIGAAAGGGLGFPFVLTGGLSIVAAAFIWVWLRRSPVHVRGAIVEGDHGPDVAPLGSSPTTRDDDALEGARPPNLLNGPFIAAVVMYFGVSLAFGVYEVVWTLYMLHLGATLEWVGGTFAIFGLGVVIASPLDGKLVDRRGALTIATAGGLAIAVCGVCYAIASEPVFPSVVVPVESIAEAFVVPALFTLVAQGTPQGRSATAQGIFGASGTIALIVASLSAGFLWEHDPALPFVFFVVGILITVAFGLLIGRSWRSRNRLPEGLGA